MQTVVKKPILQKGITFKIRNLDTNLDVCYYDKSNRICEFKTDKNGEFITHNLISGNYQIEELIAPIGYVINKNPYKFRIDENSNIINDQVIGDYFSIEIYNEKIKGSIKVLKKGEILINGDNNFFYDYTNLSNISFSIYAKEDIITNDGIIHYKKDELINTLKTDNNGNLIFNNLYLGKYYMKENSIINGYIKNERIYEFELNNNNFNHEIIIYNYLQKGNLKIIKKDSDTNEVIPNTTIALYNEFDECLFVDKTNNKGIINIDNLALGRYYLKEEVSANGYLLNDEKIYFDLEDSDKTYEIVMLNEKIMIDVPDTNIDKKYIIEIIALICIVIGMGFLVYGKRKI